MVAVEVAELSAPSAGSVKKKRNPKSVPGELKDITPATLPEDVNVRIESDPKEPGEAQVAFEANGVDLTKLTLDQLRPFARQCGCKYANNRNKFQCRKAIAIMRSFVEMRRRNPNLYGTEEVVDKTNANIIRITNIVFSGDFIDELMKINDIKTRADRETLAMPIDFWKQVAEAMNAPSEDDDMPLHLVLDDTDPHYEEISEVNLYDHDLFTHDAIKKKIRALFECRRVMKNNMTKSGEHGSDPMEFVDVAMKGIPGIGKLGMYYFFLRCNENKEIDNTFAIEMDDAIRVNTDTVTTTTNRDTNSAKKRAYESIVTLSKAATVIANEMNRNLLENWLKEYLIDRETVHGLPPERAAAAGGGPARGGGGGVAAAAAAGGPRDGGGAAATGGLGARVVVGASPAGRQNANLHRNNVVTPSPQQAGVDPATGAVATRLDAAGIGNNAAGTTAVERSVANMRNTVSANLSANHQNIGPSRAAENVEATGNAFHRSLKCLREMREIERFEREMGYLDRADEVRAKRIRLEDSWLGNIDVE